MTSYSFSWRLTPDDAQYSIYSGPPQGGWIDLPETLDYRSEFPPVRNQGEQAASVAHAVATVKEWQERSSSYFSPQFIYNLRLNYPQEGMSFKDALDILRSHGICQEYIFPYNRSEIGSQIPKSVFSSADNYKIGSYARISDDLNKVKTALVTNGPVLIGFCVFNQEEHFWIKRSHDRLLGSQALLIVGYTKDSFILRNSWGQDWGDNGYTYYPFTDFLARKHCEIWTIADNQSQMIAPPVSNSIPPKCGCVLL